MRENLYTMEIITTLKVLFFLLFFTRNNLKSVVLSADKTVVNILYIVKTFLSNITNYEYSTRLGFLHIPYY